MKIFARNLLLGLFLAVCLTACLSKEELAALVKKGVIYKDSFYCVNKDTNVVEVAFSFPSRAVIFDQTVSGYEKLSDLKKDIIKKIDDIDLALVFYRTGQRNQPLQVVSLNYNSETKRFDNQAGYESFEDPWQFAFNYKVSNADIALDAEIRAAVRVVFDRKTEEAIFSDELVIRPLNCKEGYSSNLAKCDCEKIIKVAAGSSNSIGEVKLPPIIPPTLVILQPGEMIAPGLTVAGSPQEIVFPNGSGWLYLLQPSELLLAKVFKFDICEWIIPDIYNMDNAFYQQTWSPFVSTLFNNINNKSKENKGNYFGILLQGSADGGTVCSDKTKDKMSEIENLVHSQTIPYLFREQFKGTVTTNESWRASSPVLNDDLPNLRGSSIKTAMQHSVLKDVAKVGLINGQIVHSYSPNDRKVLVYLLQTPFDLSKSYPVIFK